MCPYSDDRAEYVPGFFQIVRSMTWPVTFSFMVANLTVFTEYCVVPIGLYSTSEIAGGEGTVFITSSECYFYLSLFSCLYIKKQHRTNHKVEDNQHNNSRTTTTVEK